MSFPRRVFVLFILPFTLASYGIASVSVSSPSNGATVGSPVQYVASSSSGCSKGVASMGVYVDNALVHVVNGNNLDASISMSAGSHHTVVQEWDYCGGSTYTPVDLSVTNDSNVWVNSPVPNSTVGSQVRYAATSSTGTCSKGVASMGIYVNNKLTFVSPGSTLNTSISLSPGSYDTVVQEWDFCGGSVFKHVPINVVASDGQGNTFNNLQAAGGWKGFGEYPPKYDVCSNCGGGVTWSMQQGVQSPSLSGNATRFQIGGTHPYSDVLWTNPLIGHFSTQGMPDPDHKIIPNLHNFVYDLYFYGANLELSQVLEFDINQYLNGNGFTWGHQCRIAGGHEFDIWDNVNWKWIPTGIPCYPNNNAWNHLTLEVSRTWDNKLQYHAITLNGVRRVLDWYYPPFSTGDWYGVTINYQMDGNYQQDPYSVVVDKFSLTYW